METTGGDTGKGVAPAANDLASALTQSAARETGVAEDFGNSRVMDGESVHLSAAYSSLFSHPKRQSI